MTVIVNLRSEDEEKALCAFLDSLKYDYQTTSENIAVTIEQQNEIIRRDRAFIDGQTSARNWDDIKKDLERV